MVDKVCPRCGEPYSYLERRGGYLYAVHDFRRYTPDRRLVGRRRRCYLGVDPVAKLQKMPPGLRVRLFDGIKRFVRKNEMTEEERKILLELSSVITEVVR